MKEQILGKGLGKETEVQNVCLFDSLTLLYFSFSGIQWDKTTSYGEAENMTFLFLFVYLHSYNIARCTSPEIWAQQYMLCQYISPHVSGWNAGYLPVLAKWLQVLLCAHLHSFYSVHFRWYRVRGDGGWCVVLHVPVGQLESGVPDDCGSLQTQQPGVRWQTVHHRRTGCIREPGPCGEVRVTPTQQQFASKQQTSPADPSWWPHTCVQL